MILSEMEIHHQPRYQELIDHLSKQLPKHLAQMKREKEEYTYFLDPNDPQILTLESELITTHTQKLKTTLLTTDPAFPSAFTSLALELFEDAVKGDLSDNKTELRNESEIANFIEEWATFIQAIQENIYQGTSYFWDENLLENDTEFVSLFLNLFLYSQQTANEKEQQELKN